MTGSSPSGWLLLLRVVHFVAILFVMVSISKVDLRLMGLADRRTPVTELLAEMLPWTWASFGVAAITGIGLFLTNPSGFYGNTSFRLKILSLVLAGLNMALFHAFAWKRVAQWDDGVPTAPAAKVAGGLSLALWIAVLAFGFGIIFTGGTLSPGR